MGLLPAFQRAIAALILLFHGMVLPALLWAEPLPAPAPTPPPVRTAHASA